MREQMRNQNLGKYFNVDKAVLTWEISGAFQHPLEVLPHGSPSLENPPCHVSFFSQSPPPNSFKQISLCVHVCVRACVYKMLTRS